MCWDYVKLLTEQTTSGHNPILGALAVIGVATLAGAVGGAIGYTVATLVTGTEFDTTSFAVSTIGGGLTAGAATTVALLGGGPVGFLATMATGNMIQYAVDRQLHEDPVDVLNPEDQIMLGGSFAIGALGGAIGGQTTSSFVTGSMRRMAMEFGEQTVYQTTRQAGRLFLHELIDEGAVSSIRSGISTVFSSFSTRLLELTKKRPISNGLIKE